MNSGRKPKTYKPPTSQRLEKAALHYIDRYATSAVNLQRVLERKVQRACFALDLDPEDYSCEIQAVVDKCVSCGLVDDKTFAETKVSSLRRKGYSRRKIEVLLNGKGIGRSMIHSVLDENGSDENEAAHRYAKRRRLGPYREPDKRKIKRDKDMAALCRAGFSYAIAMSVIDSDPEDYRS